MVRPLRPPAADRILIIRLGALGDVVRTIPSAHALRALYPGAHLGWLVESGARGVVETAGVVDEVIVFPREALMGVIREADALALWRRLARFVAELRRSRFEIVLDFHGLLKSGLLARLSGAPTRIGYGWKGARELSQLFTNRHVDLPTGPLSRYDRNAALLGALTPDVRLPDGPFLAASRLARARLGDAAAGGFVLIHPGSSPGAAHKRYPPSAWADVARQLGAQGLDCRVVAGPDRDEQRRAERIVRESRGVARLAPETRSFDDLLAIIGRCSIFVSGDTGPLHAASLCGVPVLQLLGPTDPVQNAPWAGSPWARVHVPLPCSPCRRGCAEAPCMRAIPPARVVEEILVLSASVPPTHRHSIERAR